MQLTGLEAGSRSAERYYFVKKYEATLEQRHIAEAAGRQAEARVRAGASRPVQPPRSGRAGKLQPNFARYLAVRTRSDARAKTPVGVMIWDTQTQEIVGNSMYDMNSPPPAGASVKFETFAAEYVGAGIKCPAQAAALEIEFHADQQGLVARQLEVGLSGLSR